MTKRNIIRVATGFTEYEVIQNEENKKWNIKNLSTNQLVGDGTKPLEYDYSGEAYRFFNHLQTIAKTHPKYIEQIIYDWVGESFGINEAEDPSWNIKLLASELQTELLSEHEPICKVQYIDDDDYDKEDEEPEVAIVEDEDGFKYPDTDITKNGDGSYCYNDDDTETYAIDTFTNEQWPTYEMRKEVDLGWLSDTTVRGFKARGEKLTFEE